MKRENALIYGMRHQVYGRDAESMSLNSSRYSIEKDYRVDNLNNSIISHKNELMA